MTSEVPRHGHPSTLPPSVTGKILPFCNAGTLACPTRAMHIR